MNMIHEKIPVNKRHYLIDGTFKIVPYGCFKQLLVIHLGKFDTVHPFIYVLMSNKTQIAYSHVFKYIHNNIFKLDCASFTTDYELAMKNAIRSLFPKTRLVSCWFHFVQAVRKHMSQMKSLFDLIRKCERARKIYYKLQSIALLRPDLIENAFYAIKAEALSFNKAFEPFIEYFERQ